MNVPTLFWDEPLVGLAALCLLMDLCHPSPDDAVLGAVLDKLVGDLEAWRWSRTVARLESPHGVLDLPIFGHHTVPRDEVLKLSSLHRCARHGEPDRRIHAQQLLATSVHPAIRTLTQQLLAKTDH